CTYTHDTWPPLRRPPTCGSWKSAAEYVAPDPTRSPAGSPWVPPVFPHRIPVPTCPIPNRTQLPSNIWVAHACSAANTPPAPTTALGTDPTARGGDRARDPL